VNSRCTGVMFFEHSESIFVEVVSGKGELLMSGQMAPTTYRKGDQQSWDRNGGEVDGDLLRDDHLQELARIGALAAKTWNSSVDIEFGFFDGECIPYLFQCRPVTKPWPFTSTSPSVGGSRRVDAHGVSCSPGMAQGVGINWSAFPKGPTTPSSQSIALVDFLSEQNYDLIFDTQGIISERVGSQLNHLSIACRELGIPYVSGVDQARTRFHEQSVVLDGTKGTVSVIGEDFPVFGKHGTVVASDVGHRVGESGCAQKSAPILAVSPDLAPGFQGGIFLLLEGLYHGTTEADLVEGMVRYLGEVFKNETSHEVVKLRLPRLFAEEGSLLRQVVPECSFSPEMEARVFQKVIEKVLHCSGRKLVLDVNGDQMGEC